MNNVPDRWILVRTVYNKEETYKILAGWSGSYLYGQSWKMNSGIVKVEDKDDYFLFHGYTGSIYQCYKTSYGVNNITAGIISSLKEQASKVDYAEIEDYSYEDAIKWCTQ